MRETDECVKQMKVESKPFLDKLCHRRQYKGTLAFQAVTNRL